jgi:tRNA(Ile)-lysidine synthase
MKTMDLHEFFEAVCRTYRLFQPNDRILVAVSGGVDSMVLLDLLNRLRIPWNLRLGVVHLNHGMRGAASDNDERFVQQTARELGLPFFSKKCDRRLFSLMRDLSPEERLRDVRYRWLETIRKRGGYCWLALAHQGNDQAETILMNLVRGSGIKGMGGMSLSRGSLIRPLLPVLRSQIEDYAEKRGLRHVEDLSNASRSYLRNRIRLDLVPCFEKTFRKSVVPSINTTGFFLQDIHGILQKNAKTAVKRAIGRSRGDEIVLEIEPFLRYLDTIQVLILQEIWGRLSESGRPLSRNVLERTLELARSGKSGRRVNWGRDFQSVISSGNLIFCRKDLGFPAVEVTIGRPVKVEELGLVLDFEVTNRDRIGTLKHGPGVEYMDLQKISGPMILRPWKAGDRFIPLGMHGKKKLQDFFVDCGISFHERSRIPVLEINGEIAWVVGRRIDDRFKIEERTTRILKVSITDPAAGRRTRRRT